MEAIGEMLVVKPYFEEQTGGFVVPTEQKLADTGIIVDIGPDVKLPDVGRKGNLQIGDKVVFHEYAGKNFEREGEKFILLRLQELYVKI